MPPIEAFQMNRQGSRYGTTYQPTTRSSALDRSMPPISTGRTAALIRTINAGGMNISPNHPTRVSRPSRTSQTSPERPLRIHTNITQRRLPSRDRLVCMNWNFITIEKKYLFSMRQLMELPRQIMNDMSHLIQQLLCIRLALFLSQTMRSNRKSSSLDFLHLSDE